MNGRRRGAMVLLALCLAGMGSPGVAEAAGFSKILGVLVPGALKSAGKALSGFFVAYEGGKILDRLLGEDLASQLESVRADLHTVIESEVDEVAAAVGEEQTLRQEAVEAVESELELVDRALAVLRGEVRDVGGAVARIKEDQARLEAGIEELDRRMMALEARVDRLGGRIDRLDARVAILEDALIRDCLDLRNAPRVGAMGFRTLQRDRAVLIDSSDSERLHLTVRAFLDVCTADLTERGLLLQLAWVTWGLDRELSLFATFKHIEQGGFDPVSLNQLTRIEYPLDRPVHPVDGQVTEIFIPYAEIPFSATRRLALALVMTHDGGPIYSLPDRVLNCRFGQQTQCLWGR